MTWTDTMHYYVAWALVTILLVMPAIANNNCDVLDKIGEKNKCYDKILESDPQNIEALLGKCEYGNSSTPKEIDECIKYCNRVIVIDSKISEAWGEKSYRLKEKGNLFELKGDVFKQGNTTDSLYEVLKLNETECYNTIQCYDDAKRCYNETIQFADKAIEADSRNAYAWDAKGDVLFKLQRYEEAIRCYNEVIEINPKSTDVFWANVWASKGSALYKQSKYEDAILCYDRSIEMVENSTEFGAQSANEASAYRGKSRCLMKLGRIEEADASLAKAEELQGVRLS